MGVGASTANDPDIGTVVALERFFLTKIGQYVSGTDGQVHQTLLLALFRDPRNVNGMKQMILLFIRNDFKKPNSIPQEGTDLYYLIDTLKSLLTFGTYHRLQTQWLRDDLIYAAMGVIYLQTALPDIYKDIQNVLTIAKNSPMSRIDAHATRFVQTALTNESNQNRLFAPEPDGTIPSTHVGPAVAGTTETDYGEMSLQPRPSSPGQGPAVKEPDVAVAMQLIEADEEETNRRISSALTAPPPSVTKTDLATDMASPLQTYLENVSVWTNSPLMTDFEERTSTEAVIRRSRELRDSSDAVIRRARQFREDIRYLTMSSPNGQQITSTAPRTDPSPSTQPPVVSTNQTFQIAPTQLRFEEEMGEVKPSTRGITRSQSTEAVNGVMNSIVDGAFNTHMTNEENARNEAEGINEFLNNVFDEVEDRIQGTPTVPMPPRFEAGPPRIHPLIRVGDETFDLQELMNIPEYTGETPEQENQRRQQLIDYHFFDPNRIEIDARTFPSEIPAVSSAREITISRVVNDFPAQQRTYSIERPVVHENLTITGTEPVPPQRVHSRSEVDVRNVFDYRRLPGMTDPMPFRRPVDRPSDVRPNPSQPLPLYRENHASGPHGPRVHVPLRLRHPPVVAAPVPPAPPGAPPPPGGPGGNRQKKNSINPIRARGNGSIRQATPYKKIDYEPLVRPVAMDKLALGAIGVAAVAPLISPCFCRCVCTA